jgi:hypothetical protein
MGLELNSVGLTKPQRSLEQRRWKVLMDSDNLRCQLQNKSYFYHIYQNNKLLKTSVECSRTQMTTENGLIFILILHGGTQI